MALFQTSGAQTTEFTYQGQLMSSSALANGSFDFEFALFDGGGTQIGPTATRTSVTVTNGIFTVNLDFGSSFPGATRFLEIRVRQSGGGAFTTLSPRQPINSSPYSIKSLTAATADNAVNAATAANSTQLAGIAANQYLQTNGNGSGLTNLNAGSITSGTLANARLGQIPTANIADSAVTGAKIATGEVVKSLNGLKDNVTLAPGANISITPSGNSLTIASTGGLNGGGSANTVPVWTGAAALGDSLISQSAGQVNLPTGVNLAANPQGDQVRFGTPDGEVGLTMSGKTSGRADIRYDGVLKILNAPAGQTPADTQGIAINSTGSTAVGTSEFTAKLNVSGNDSGSCGPMKVSWGAGSSSTPCGTVLNLASDDSSVSFLRALNGNGTTVASLTGAGTLQLGGSVEASGSLSGVFPSGTVTTSLCRGVGPAQLVYPIVTCNTSSLRFKKDVTDYLPGLNAVTKLRPIRFSWKQDDAPDFGLGAEDVARIAPELTFNDGDGSAMGIRYDRLGVMLINAVKDLQKLIEGQQRTIDKQGQEIRSQRRQLRSLQAKAAKRGPR
jgi:hypothetical protein